MSGYHGYKQAGEPLNNCLTDQDGRCSRRLQNVVDHKTSSTYPQLESILQSPGRDLLRAVQAKLDQTKTNKSPTPSGRGSSEFLDAEDSLCGVPLHHVEAHMNLHCHLDADADSGSQTRLHLDRGNTDVWYSAVSIDEVDGKTVWESRAESGDHTF